jgi:hypothetical protein
LSQQISKSSLSEPQRKLVELFQRINFGRIESLHVRGGLPVLDDPAPRVIQTRRMGSRNGPRDEAELRDFWLKEPVIDLLQIIRELGDGEVLTITVMHGLPQVAEIQHRPEE